MKTTRLRYLVPILASAACSAGGTATVDNSSGTSFAAQTVAGFFTSKEGFAEVVIATAPDVCHYLVDSSNSPPSPFKAGDQELTFVVANTNNPGPAAAQLAGAYPIVVDGDIQQDAEMNEAQASYTLYTGSEAPVGGGLTGLSGSVTVDTLTDSTFKGSFDIEVGDHSTTPPTSMTHLSGSFDASYCGVPFPTD